MSSYAKERVCSTTGLKLVTGPVNGLRIAVQSYGPLSPLERSSGVPRENWGRWDTPGRTIYLAENKSTALRECLSWARMTHSHGRKLDKLAMLWDLTTEEVMQEISADWDASGGMQPGHLPRIWREDRLIYRISVPETSGPWIDLDDQTTLDALTRIGGQLGLPSGYMPADGLIDRSVTFSNDRELTTGLSELMRSIVLDDGSEAAGVRFSSKVGNGLCWAYWMRRADLGLSEYVTVKHGIEIRSDDPELKQVLEAWSIKMW